MNFKNDFPLLQNYPELVYLDNAASVQKPKAVLDAVHEFITHDYANVHRGVYDLSQRAEEVFWQCRKTIARWHGCRDSEVVFIGGTTQGITMLTHALARSGWIESGRVIVLSKGEHHANIVPWQIVAEQTDAVIKRVDIDQYGEIEYDHLQKIIDEGNVSIISIQACSNVTGTIQDLVQIRKIIGNDTALVVDASQSIPHYAIDTEKVSPDFIFWTGHKVGAYTGCGVMIGKKKHLDALTPGRGGGGAIDQVTMQGHSYQGSPDKFEPGTPNLIGAVSMASALDYLTSIGGYETIMNHEEDLIDYCLEQSTQLERYGMNLIGTTDPKKRIGVFSYTSDHHNLHSLGQRLGQQQICVRTGGQCAHPLHEELHCEGTLRMSLWISNEMADCEKFFEVLKEVV